jgi:putative transposase
MSWGLVMPAPLSGDLRERIVAAIRDGSSMRGAAARFSVSPSSAIKLMARFRATGSVAPARYGGHRRPVLLPHEELLGALVSGRPDITLAEIRDELRQQRGVSVCLATIHVSLRRLVVVMDNLAAHKTAGIRRSRRPAPTCSTCRPTAPISTRSSSSLPSSKRYCARRPRAPKRLYGKPPASYSIWFRPSSAGAISPMPDTIPPNAKML